MLLKVLTTLELLDMFSNYWHIRVYYQKSLIRNTFFQMHPVLHRWDVPDGGFIPFVHL